MKAEDFDNILKDKMGSSSLQNSDGMDWDKFSETLDSIDELTPQHSPTDAFDAALAAKLSSTTLMDNKGMDWGNFAFTLDNIPDLAADNTAFDQVINQKMDNLNFAYQADDWEKLSKRLDKEGLLNNQIISIKSLELFIFVLFVWGLQHMYNPQMPNNHIPSYQQQIDSDKENKNDSTKEVIFADATLPNKENIVKSINTDSNNNRAVTNNEAIIAVNNAVNSLHNSSIEFAPKETLKTSTSPQYTVFKNDNVTVVENDHLNIESLHKRNTVVVNPLTTELSTIKYTNKDASTETIASLLLNPAIKVFQPKSNLLLGGHMVGKMNNVFSMTDTNSEWGILEYTDITSSYGAGLSFNWVKNNFAISTGLEYSQIKYETYPVINITGSGLEVFNESYDADINNTVQLNMMSIPVNLKYYFSKDRKWKAYGKFGMAIHFSLEKITEKQDNSTETEIGGNIEVDRIGLKTNTKTSIFDADNNLKENTFATLDIGLGLERKLSDKYSFFIEPSYEFNLSSKNVQSTTSARINSFGLRTGVYYNL